MTRRLQVLLDEAELAEIRRVARRHRMTVAEWVRQALRRPRQEVPSGDPHRKIALVRKTSRHAFPTADPAEMLEGCWPYGAIVSVNEPTARP